MQVARLSVIALSLVASVSGAQGDSARLPGVDDWRLDIDQLAADIRLIHPAPFAQKGNLAFLREVRAIKDSVPLMSEEQRVVRLMRFVATLGDGHTWLEPNNPRFARWYPIRIYTFADGPFVTAAHTSVRDLAGAQVLEIGGRPAAAALEDARSLLPDENPWAAIERSYAALNAGLMRGLGYAEADGSLRVKFRLADRREVVRTLTPMASNHPRFKKDDATFEWHFRPEIFGPPIGTDEDWISAYGGVKSLALMTTDSTRPPFWLDRKPYVARALPASSAYYIRNNHVSDTDFLPFFQAAMAEVDRIKPKHLIVDWRFNFGGDGSKLQYLIREFVKRSDHRPWGNLYVLVGPKTFSAAVMAVDALLYAVQGTVVGEPSAAGWNHFGDPTARPLNRTGLLLNVSTLTHQLGASDDLSTFIPVDVPAPFTFADYSTGRDPAVDPILRGEDMRSIPMIAQTDGGTAARRAWEERKRKFGNVPWFAPPAEYDMRQACDLLREAKRFAEAVDTCRLNADIHPHVWNTWYNLGGAQRAAGLMKERLPSYRCVIAIAPNNWNVPTLRQLMSQPGNEGDDTAPGCPVPRLRP